MPLYNSGLVIVYPNQVPYDTDVLRTNLYALTGDSALAATMLGVGTNYSTKVRGFPCVPVSPSGLSVVVGSNQTPDIIYQLAPLNATAYGSLPADTAASDYQYKQGFNWGQATLGTPAPLVLGNTVIHLVEVAFSTQDVNNISRPYYNSVDPSVPIFMNNYDTRTNLAVITLKQGVEAVSPVPPTPDPGYIGLWYVTVTYGQTVITSGNIAKVSAVEGNPFITEDLTQKIGPSGLTNYVTIPNLQNLTNLVANDTGTTNNVVVAPTPAFTSKFGIVYANIAHTNTGASTLVVNSFSSVPILKYDVGGTTALVGGELQATYVAQLYLTASYAILINPFPIPTVLVTPQDIRNNTYTYAGADSGTVNNVVVTAPSMWVLDGDSQIMVLIGHNNTGASTLTVGVNTYNITKPSSSGVAPVALTGGELVSGSFSTFIYDSVSSSMILQNTRDYIDYSQARTFDQVSGVDTGTTNNLVVNTNIPYSSLVSGTNVWVYVAHTNTATASITLSSLATKQIYVKSDPTAGAIPTTGGELQINTWAQLVYVVNGSSTYFELQNPTYPKQNYAQFYQSSSQSVSHGLLLPLNMDVAQYSTNYITYSVSPLSISIVVAGRYRISFGAFTTYPFGSAATNYYVVYLNGSAYRTVGAVQSATVGIYQCATSFEDNFSASDVIQIYFDNNDPGTGSATVCYNSPPAIPAQSNFFEITYLGST